MPRLARLGLVLFCAWYFIDLGQALCQDGREDASNHTLSLNRTKRQSNSKVLPWRKIYTFTKKFAKIAGDNNFMSKVNQMIVTKAGGVSKSPTYGYRYGGGYRGGYGGYGGYPMVQYSPPVVYYVPVQQQQYAVVPISNINSFTGNFGNTVSNQELLEQLISLIQAALDDGGGDST